MFVDASVIVAILGRETGHDEIEERLANAGRRFFVSPLVKFEASVALARQKTKAPGAKPSPDMLLRSQAVVDAFIDDIGAKEITISAEIGRYAVMASATYGKAVGHPANLNFGDCFAYACAKTLQIGLLYKGEDFAKTDLA